MQEFFAAGAPHEPAVCLDDHVIEPESREDALIGIALLLVRQVETGIGVIERVGVFHSEFAAAEQSGTRTSLITVLVLNLVDRERKFFV